MEKLHPLSVDDLDSVVAEDLRAMPARTLTGRTDADWIRGRCPECGDDLVSNMYYVGGQGYLIVWECWGSLSEDPACTYRRLL